MKIAIAPFPALAGYVSREFWSTFSALRREHGWHLKENFHPGHAVAKVVLFWESYPAVVRHARSLKEAGARVYVMTDDLHKREREGMREALQLADGILSTYAPVFGDFFPEVDAAKVRWIPHAASPDFLLPIDETPAPVVFVSGAVSEHYPMRMRMRELARRRPELARVHVHPGYYGRYDYAGDDRVGRGYAEKIGACLAAFTDGLRYRYIVAKHFEIPATGALLIADRACAPQLAMLGFVDGEHYVSASADDLEHVVERALEPQNRDEIDAIRRRGHALVHARHTTACRAREIDASCR